MKLLKYVPIALLTVATSQAAVTISGAAATGVKNAMGTQLATGSLAIWIADTTGNGFGALTEQIALNSTLKLGDMFAGDTIIARVSSTQFGTAPNNGRVPSTFNYDNPAAVGGAPDVAPGTSIAIVWFSMANGETVAAATTTATNGMMFGIAQGVGNPTVGGWITGAQTSGTIGFSTTGTYTAANPFKGLVAADFTGTGKSINNAVPSFSVVPEPSAALLGALGALGLLRRRR